MSGYLLSIAGIVFITGILSAILPVGKTTSVIKSTAKLCVLLVILTPVAEFMLKGGEQEKNFSDIFTQTVIQTDESFIDYCSRKRIEELQEDVVEWTKKNCDCIVVVKAVWEYEEQSDGKYVEKAIRILRLEISFLEEENTEEKKSVMFAIGEKYGAEVVES